MNENNLLGSSSGFRCGTGKTRSRISLERFFVLVSKKFLVILGQFLSALLSDRYLVYAFCCRQQLTVVALFPIF